MCLKRLLRIFEARLIQARLESFLIALSFEMRLADLASVVIKRAL